MVMILSDCNEYKFKLVVQFKMAHVQLLIFLALVIIAQGFPKNCQMFNPNNYSQCVLCLKTYYLDKGKCMACPDTPSSSKQCSQTNSLQAEQSPAQNSSSELAAALPLNRSENKAQSILANTFLKSSGAIVLNASNPVNTPATASNTTALQSNNQSGGNISAQSLGMRQKESGATNQTNKTANLNTSPSANSNDLTQIVFQYLPPHCSEFTIVPALACSKCDTGYILSGNKACEIINSSLSKPSANQTNQSAENQSQIQTIPNDLKVSSTLAAGGSSLPILTTIPSSINSNPQPIFVPIPNTSPLTSSPTSTLNTTLNGSKALTVNSYSSSQASPVVMPRNITIVDKNCYEININFSLRRPVSQDNARCSCYTGFYYDLSKQLCLPLNPYCKTATTQNKCTSCYMGYSLIEGNCTLLSSSQPAKQTSSSTSYQIDPNCQSYEQNSNVCSVCANRYYFDRTKSLCRQVDSSCQTWDKSNGYCTSCYSGYSAGPNDKSCKPIVPSSSSSTSQSPTSSCAKFTGNVCTLCAYRTILNNGMCFPVSDLCSTFNSKFGFCLSCYSGYLLNNGECQKIQVNNDPNCANSIGNACQQCINGYYVDNAGVCQAVSGLCVGYNPQNGFCLDCVYPYTLNQSNGQCIYNP